ncbi:sulfite exporter TauE/SafE family protein [Candidatus Woesearchaeota archaeon]|nr:sulfite exporter TauE/SafE family protein [Candidatus Woesearchaeota archaeon]
MIEILILIFALIAEIIGTIAGFGSSTIFVPLTLFVLDFKTTLVIAAFFHLFGNIARIALFKKVEKKIVWYFGVPSVILAVIGAILVKYISSNILKFLLGIFLLVFSITSLIKPKLKLSATSTNAIIGGTLSGFFTGLIGTGGVLRSTFLTAFNLPKIKYITTAATIALAIDLTRIPVYFTIQLIEPKYYYYIPLLLIPAILGTYIGKRIINKISQKSFRKIVLTAILLISIKFILDSL